MYRRKVKSKQGDRNYFKATAEKVHIKNKPTTSLVARGSTRL